MLRGHALLLVPCGGNVDIWQKLTVPRVPAFSMELTPSRLSGANSSDAGRSRVVAKGLAIQEATWMRMGYSSQCGRKSLNQLGL